MKNIDEDADGLTAILEAPTIPSDFGFTEEHDLARTQARRFLQEHSSIERVRKLALDDVGFDPATWKQIAELGWIGLVSPEQYGGAGFDQLHLALLFEEMGRRLLPSPYFGTMLALAGIESAGSDAQKREWCPSIISGEKLATVALSEPDPSWEPNDVQTRVSPDSAKLTGTKTHVLFGRQADLFVVPARAGDQVGLYLVKAGQDAVRVEPEVSVDPTRRTARVIFEGADSIRLAGEDRAELGTWLAKGQAMLAAEMVGAIEATLGLTRDYAADREQFGRKIGSFQAVKHPIVDIMCGLELARSQALAAAAAFEAKDGKAPTAARMAKTLASDTFAYATRKGVQLHGGFGFTWDCDVHFYFKRALWSRGTLGDALHHRRHLAAEIFDHA